MFTKKKSLLLSCSLVMGLSLMPAFSEEASSICADPLKKICTDTIKERKNRDAFIEKMKKEISAEAKVTAEPRIKEMKKKISKIRFVKRALQTLKINNQETMKAAKKRVAGIETVVTNPENVALLKGYMNQAIDESNFTLETKASFKNVISSIIIGNFADFLEKSDLEDSLLGQLLANPCGSDGLVSNAFATNLGQERYVLICPGFLVTMSQTPNEKERLDSILHAISHEMGHHIDNHVAGNEVYAPFISCVSDNFASKFNKTGDDEKFCKKNKDQGAAACNKQVTLSHSGELIADVWGIKVLSIHAKKQNYSFAETDTLLTNSWSNLCGAEDEGIHPSGDFRMGTLLRTNPDISNHLACDNSGIKTKVACTFDGVVGL